MTCYNRNEPTGFAQQDIFCSATLLGGGTVSGCSLSANTSSVPSSYASYVMVSLYCSTKALTEFRLQIYICKQVLIYHMMLIVNVGDVKWDKVTHGLTR